MKDGKPWYMVGCINEIGGRQKADNISGLLGETSLEQYIVRKKHQRVWLWMVSFSVSGLTA